MYDPKQYWEGRGKDYRAKSPTWPEESNELKNFLEGKDLVILEVGSGYGRIFDFLGRPTRMYLCDISESMIDECYNRTGKMPFLWDGINICQGDKVYDLVISFSVLLHVPPNSIMNHISELLRVGKEVYIATYSGLQNGKHYFHHDYLELFKQLEAELVSCKIFSGSRVHYVVRK